MHVSLIIEILKRNRNDYKLFGIIEFLVQWLFSYKVEPQQDEKEVPIVISMYRPHYTSHRIFLSYSTFSLLSGF